MSVGNDDDDDDADGDGDGDNNYADVSGLYKNPKETLVYLQKKKKKQQQQQKKSNERRAILYISPFFFARAVACSMQAHGVENTE